MIGLTPENLRLLVELPEGENRLEWIAANGILVCEVVLF